MHMFKSLWLVAGVSATVQAGMIINEFHYDNAGTDAGEFIEVVTRPADRPSVLAGQVAAVLYDGAGGQVYYQVDLQLFTFHGTLADGWDYYSRAVSGMQNGPHDGIAITRDGSVLEFLSYEGAFQAAGGPAAGLTAHDIGISEPATAPVGSSLQRVDFGMEWVLTEGHNTRGGVNSCNAIPAPGALGLALVGALYLGRSVRGRHKD